VIPVEGSGARELLTTRGHDVIVFSWDHENARFDDSANTQNLSVIASVETRADKAGNRWNDGKADAKGRLWAGMSLGRDSRSYYNAFKILFPNVRRMHFVDIIANWKLNFRADMH
jgi:sugar lactone lactonase YvrE